MGSGTVRRIGVGVVLALALLTEGAAPRGDERSLVLAQARTTSSGFACPEPRPRVEVSSREIDVLIWPEYVPRDVVDCFALVYGMTVNLVEDDTLESMERRLAERRANYDLAQPTGFAVPHWIRRGLLQKLDTGRLANLGNVDPSYLSPPFDPNGEYLVPYQAGSAGIAYNADRIAEPPTAWADLWRPEYVGRLLLVDDPRYIIGATLLALGHDANSTDLGQLKQARAKLAELMPGVRMVESSIPSAPLIAGDVDVGVIWNGDALLAARSNPAIKYVYPREGAVFWQDGYAIPAGAAHPDAAYAWIEYSLQDDVFWLMLRDSPYTNPNRAALEYARANHPALYAAYADSPTSNPPAEARRRGHQLGDVGDTTRVFEFIWIDVGAR